MKITKDYLKKLIKEEIAVMEGDDDEFVYREPEFTAEEKKVRDQIDSLIEAIEDMEESNPEMTDDYVYLFRALKAAGVNVKAVAMMT